MKISNVFKLIFVFTTFLTLSACSGALPGADARKVSTNPNERVRQNIEQGKGFRLMDNVGNKGSGNFEFASSNELWRATLDIIDFMPLASANYSGGILITDWYSDGTDNNESIKVSVRFLTNEVRSDALDIKIFYKNCVKDNCIIKEKSTVLAKEMKIAILKKAAIYLKQNKDETFKPYTGTFDPTK